MELWVDDRERAVITYLGKFMIRVERLTVGDYAFVYNGRVIMVIERKTLADLASSIKDGRMENNIKLLAAQEQSGCQILYIIEGHAYPTPDKKYGRIPFKCLQGKLDSLMFRHNIKIIWTKDSEHTANRLIGLTSTFERMAIDGVFGEFIGGEVPETVIKPKHDIDINQVHINMLKSIKGISYKMAGAILAHYSITDILTGNTDEKTWFNAKYESGLLLKKKGTRMHKICSKLEHSHYVKILSCINGLTLETATTILDIIPFIDILAGADVSNIQKNEKRKIGKVINDRIHDTFNHKVN